MVTVTVTLNVPVFEYACGNIALLTADMVTAADWSPKSTLIVDALVGFPASLTSMSPVMPRKNVGGVLVTETRLEGVDVGVVVPGAVADELVQPARSAAVANAPTQ